MNGHSETSDLLWTPLGLKTGRYGSEGAEEVLPRWRTSCHSTVFHLLSNCRRTEAAMQQWALPVELGRRQPLDWANGRVETLLWHDHTGCSLTDRLRVLLPYHFCLLEALQPLPLLQLEMLAGSQCSKDLCNEKPNTNQTCALLLISVMSRRFNINWIYLGELGL